MMPKKFFSINVELTNKCPLRCPQCYCSLNGDKHIALNLAKQKIQEATEHGVSVVNLSGGETLCYPWLYELISFASKKCENVNIAISGCYFNDTVLHNLIEAGVTMISVSLNGSTKEINSITRDGYDLAIKALKTLRNCNNIQTCINWVMHSSNCDDFPNIVKIAEDFNVSLIDVIMFKPDSRNELNSFPSGNQMKQIADYIHNYCGPVKIQVESCFSPMLALVCNYSWLGNFNTSERKGCGAGIYMYNINVDGFYSPCRHLDHFENYDTLDEYFEKSEFIHSVQRFESDLREPCAICSLQRYCRPCVAITNKLYGGEFKGHSPCQVWQLNESPLPKTR